ncbi:MAG: hypothetical protein PVI30_16575 [Myxococcales bacterium]|jgi:hypothetical protein
MEDLWQAVAGTELLALEGVGLAAAVVPPISKRLAEREAAMANVEAHASPPDQAEIEAQQGQLLGRIKRFFSL